MKRSYLLLSLLALLATVAPAQTTLRVQLVPATTPADQLLYLAGSFNAWQPAAPGYALSRQAAGSYQPVLPATVRGPQECKRTRGSWATAEADAHFAAIANRPADFGAGPATLPLSVASWQDQRPGGSPPTPAAKAHPRAQG